MTRNVYKLLFLLIITAICMVLLCSCKPAEVKNGAAEGEMEQIFREEDYQAEYETINEDASHITMRLSQNVYADTDLTEYESYKDGLGIYDYSLLYRDRGYRNYEDTMNDPYIKDVEEFEERIKAYGASYWMEDSDKAQVIYNCWNFFEVWFGEQRTLEQYYEMISSYWSYYPQALPEAEEAQEISERVDTLMECLGENGFSYADKIEYCHMGEELYKTDEEVIEKAQYPGETTLREMCKDQDFYVVAVYEEVENGIRAEFHREVLKKAGEIDSDKVPDNVIVDGISVVPGGNSLCRIILDKNLDIKTFQLFQEIQIGERRKTVQIKTGKEMMQVVKEYLQDMENLRTTTIQNMELVYDVVYMGEENGKELYQLCPCWKISYFTEKEAGGSYWYFNAVTGAYIGI